MTNGDPISLIQADNQTVSPTECRQMAQELLRAREAIGWLKDDMVLGERAERRMRAILDGDESLKW